MKILNLYAGIGGNRKLWGNNLEITAVEWDASIAEIYKDLYPNDNVIVGDAHQFLLEHYNDYDFIWASPPCPTHSVTNFFLNPQGIVRYPDMGLYQEIILLQNFFKGKFVVENVKSYYDPLIKPQESGRHYFWANFRIPFLKMDKQIGRMNGKGQNVARQNNLDKLGFDLAKYEHPDKDKLLRNCVAPEIGLAIFESAMGIYKQNNAYQTGLFETIQ